MRVRALSPAAPPTLPAALYFPYAAASFGAGGTRRRTIEDMAELHMSGDEVAKDFAAVLEKVVRQGFDVVVERYRQPVAVLRPVPPPRRKISEVLALMSKNSTATMDADFARDVQTAIESHREPLEPPAWD
jgi:antitoxin (DNA-binding transcriptional repressor) of toxin-antitoxin stability system